MSKEITESTCRVCLRADDSTRNIFDEVVCFQSRLSDLLEYCGDMKIDENDSYPKVICEECVSELLVATKFRAKCKRTTEILSQIETTEAIQEEIEVDLSGIEDVIIKKETVEDVESNIEEILGSNSKGSWKITNEGDLYEQVEFLDNNEVTGNYIMLEAETEDVEEDYKDDAEVVSEINYEETGNDESIDSYEENIKENIYLEIPYPRGRNEEKMPGLDVKMRKQSVMNCNCDICGAGFIHFNNLRKHLQTHPPTKIYSCPYCRRPYTKTELYEEHVAEHVAKGEDKTKNGESIEKETPTPVVRRKSPGEDSRKAKTHKCDHCDKPFVSRSALNAHLRIHTGDRPFQCNQCFKTFTTQGGLDLHTRRHAGYKPFSCSICNRKFVESSNLKVHMRMHTGEKPHKCITCERSFARVFLLKLHQRTHTGERPYRCPFCDKAFAQQGDLAAHKRIHTGERPHKCPHCPKGFIKSSGLTAHLRRHTKVNQNNLVAKMKNEEIQDDDDKMHVEMFVVGSQESNSDNEINVKDIVLISE